MSGLWQRRPITTCELPNTSKRTELNCTIEQRLILQSTNLRIEIILVLRNVKHHLQSVAPRVGSLLHRVAVCCWKLKFGCINVSQCISVLLCVARS